MPETVHIVFRNHSTEEGTWETVVGVYEDETEAGCVAIGREEALQGADKDTDSFFTREYAVKKADKEPVPLVNHAAPYFEWMVWAEKVGDLDPRVLGFLKENPEHFNNLPSDMRQFNPLKVYATGRNWIMVSHLLKHFEKEPHGLSDDVFSKIVHGQVGDIAPQFIKYMKRHS